MIMERVKIEKRSLLIVVVIAALFFIIFEVVTAPKIICRIKCTTCPGGVIEQDFSKEARSLKGMEVEILTQDQTLLRFNDCYALKRKFFSNHYIKLYDLNWKPWL